MNFELKRRKRWLRALEISKILFESEGYFTEYLKDLTNFLEEETMYSPKIQEDLIPKLYHRAKAEGVPMTKFVDRILRDAVNGEKRRKNEG